MNTIFRVRIIQSRSCRYGNEEIKTRELGTGEQVVYITRSQVTKPYAAEAYHVVTLVTLPPSLASDVPAL